MRPSISDWQVTCNSLSKRKNIGCMLTFNIIIHIIPVNYQNLHLQIFFPILPYKIAKTFNSVWTLSWRQNVSSTNLSFDGSIFINMKYTVVSIIDTIVLQENKHVTLFVLILLEKLPENEGNLMSYIYIKLY